MKASLSVSVVVVLVIVAIVTTRWWAGKEGEAESSTLIAIEAGDRGEAFEPLELVDGMPVVRLSSDWQQRSGVEVSPLQAVTHVPETAAYGEVVEIHPLLEHRAAHNQILSELAIARADLNASQRAYERLRALHQQESYVSEGQLQQAEAAWAGDEARVTAAEVELRDRRDQMLQSWGERLTQWALENGSDVFDRLVRRQEVLLLITLRADDELPEHTEFILVGRGHDRERYQRAFLVAPAPRTDPVFQGETYFFRTRAGRLRTGMRVDAWIPLASEALSGVSLPVSAVIWYGGKPWVYVRLDEERFARRPVESYLETGDSWFVRDTAQPDELVVVRGAQMLLSEEFRWQIPEEDND